MEEIRLIRDWLLEADYPVEMIARYTDEEAIAEYEVLTGIDVPVQPVY